MIFTQVRSKALLDEINGKTILPKSYQSLKLIIKDIMGRPNIGEELLQDTGTVKISTIHKNGG